MPDHVQDRRRFLQSASAAGLSALTWANATGTAGAAAADDAPVTQRLGKAEACIMLWLGGGPAQVDTFDPKRKGNPQRKTAGSAYDAIPTSVQGVSLSEHLPLLAARMDHCAIVRTIHHNVIDEHAAATNIMHTGRAPNGTISYPSIGSVIAHERGSQSSGIPAYVLMGYPSTSRGPGFLGAKYGSVYLLDTTNGPPGLTPRPDIDAERRLRRAKLLEVRQRAYGAAHNTDAVIADYLAASDAAARLAGPSFQKVFRLDEESPALRAGYGGEFGQRCLLARRLVEAGCRFVEVAHNLNFINGTGWDTHNQGQLNQHILIRELDQALCALLDDLRRTGKLDSTLVVVAGEFGRPAEFDGGGGRGHQGAAFSCLLAGGGLRGGRAVGVTDDLAKTILEHPVSVPDLHATIYALLGVNPNKALFDSSQRPVPITDHGKPIPALFS